MYHDLHHSVRRAPFVCRGTGLDMPDPSPASPLPDRPIHAWGGPTHAPLCPETLGDTTDSIEDVTCVRCLLWISAAVTIHVVAGKILPGEGR